MCRKCSFNPHLLSLACSLSPSIERNTRHGFDSVIILPNNKHYKNFKAGKRKDLKLVSSLKMNDEKCRDRKIIRKILKLDCF